MGQLCGSISTEGKATTWLAGEYCILNLSVELTEDREEQVGEITDAPRF
jgi:hypothetical protein